MSNRLKRAKPAPAPPAASIPIASRRAKWAAVASDEVSRARAATQWRYNAIALLCLLALALVVACFSMWIILRRH